MFIKIRLTPSEHQAVTIAAARAHQTLQDFVTNALGAACVEAAKSDPVVAHVLEEAQHDPE